MQGRACSRLRYAKSRPWPRQCPTRHPILTVIKKFSLGTPAALCHVSLSSNESGPTPSPPPRRHFDYEGRAAALCPDAPGRLRLEQKTRRGLLGLNLRTPRTSLAHHEKPGAPSSRTPPPFPMHTIIRPPSPTRSSRPPEAKTAESFRQPNYDCRDHPDAVKLAVYVPGVDAAGVDEAGDDVVALLFQVRNAEARVEPTREREQQPRLGHSTCLRRAP